MNKTQIINKIIEYYKFDSNAAFARFLGIKPQVLSNWKARNTFDIELLSSKCLDINPDWLLQGKGAIKRSVLEKEKPNVKNEHISVSKNQTPIFKLDYSLDLVPKDKNLVIDYLSIPNIDQVNGATFVVNDNMFPILKVGDLVLYQTITTEINNIVFGEMYLLSIYIDNKNTYKTIRYIQKSDLGINYVKMVNEDKQYLDKNIELSKIAAMALIKATIHVK